MNARTIAATPSAVRMYVPVEPSPPNVQNSAVASSHESNGNASNIG